MLNRVAPKKKDVSMIFHFQPIKFIAAIGFASVLSVIAGNVFGSSEFTTEADSLDKREELGFYHGIAEVQPITMRASPGISSVNDTAGGVSNVINVNAKDAERVAQENLDAMKRVYELKLSQLESRLADAGTTSWDSMPAGTQCGIYMKTGNRIRAYTPCQGNNPRYGCPAGFSRSDLGYFEAGGGDRNFSTCLKQ